LRSRLLIACCWLVASSPVHALEFDARIKWFGTGSALPDHDAQRLQEGTPAYDTNVDLRLMFRQDAGSFRFLVDHSTTLISGDSFGFFNAPQTTLDQSPTDDERRVMDLTWEIEDGSRHRSLHRLDRLAMQYQKGDWSVTLGRQAVSWGSGMVFQPLDLFSPFAPTTVDRDYKAGDDLLLVERLFKDGSDLQLLLVGRRDDDGDLTGQAGSAALKWHTLVGAGEIELVAAKHYADQVYGVSGRFPLGGALVRSDIVATHLRDGGWEVSGIVNIDYSLTLLERTAYVFAEYFHNGFGVDELPVSVVTLPTELLDRLGRGEVFNVMRDYLAVGATMQWHPLWTQSLVFISNLHDGSSLMQTSLSYEPGDHQRMQFGWVEPLGRAGDEFGGLPLLGEAITTGGASTVFVRWLYYF
jgi:hypothetical protein